MCCKERSISNAVELAIAEGQAAGVAADEKRVGKPPRPLSRQAEKAMRRIEPEDVGAREAPRKSDDVEADAAGHVQYLAVSGYLQRVPGLLLVALEKRRFVHEIETAGQLGPQRAIGVPEA